MLHPVNSHMTTPTHRDERLQCVGMAAHTKGELLTVHLDEAVVARAKVEHSSHGERVRGVDVRGEG